MGNVNDFVTIDYVFIKRLEHTFVLLLNLYLICTLIVGILILKFLFSSLFSNDSQFILVKVESNNLTLHKFYL